MELENAVVSESTQTPANTALDSQSPFLSNELTKIKVTDENVALNIMVSFLNIAQRRGVFTFDESSKIWECVQMFVPPGSAADVSSAV
jgi:hypothetical protein